MVNIQRLLVLHIVTPHLLYYRVILSRHRDLVYKLSEIFRHFDLDLFSYLGFHLKLVTVPIHQASKLIGLLICNIVKILEYTHVVLEL